MHTSVHSSVFHQLTGADLKSNKTVKTVHKGCAVMTVFNRWTRFEKTGQDKKRIERKRKEKKEEKKRIE